MGIDKLKQARHHLRDWLEKSRSIANAAPSVKKIEEQLDWEVRTLDGRPAEAVNISTTGIDDRSDDLLSRVQSYYPSLPSVDNSGFTFVNSITTSTSSATVQFVMSVHQIGTPALGTKALRCRRLRPLFSPLHVAECSNQVMLDHAFVVMQACRKTQPANRRLQPAARDGILSAPRLNRRR
jgi:hypothetical protein